MSDIRVSYKTLVEVERTDPVGRIAGWMGRHPIWAGFIGGAAAVAIAMLRAFEGVRAAPVDALVISAIVVVVWMGLFYLLRRFFGRQGKRQEPVERELVAGKETFSWREDGAELARVESPTYRLFSKEVPEQMRQGRGADQPWPVWLVVDGDGEPFILETKITAGEASHYEEVDEEVIEGADEELPIGAASALLNRADRALGEG